MPPAELAEIVAKSVNLSVNDSVPAALALEAGDLFAKMAPNLARRAKQIGTEAIDWLARSKLVENPYLEDFITIHKCPSYTRVMDQVTGRVRVPEVVRNVAFASEREHRWQLNHKYSWAVPNAEALATIADQGNGRVVEAGAGSGYWSSLLRKMDVDVVAFDQHGTDISANAYHLWGDKAWTKIIKGDATTVKPYSDRALFMSFPPKADPFAHDVLSQYGGNKFVFVGDDRLGETANESFYDLLEKGWRSVKTVDIPNWETAYGMMHDYMQVFHRR